MNHLFEKFFELISTSKFLSYYRSLCNDVLENLNSGFIENKTEPDIVKSLVQSVCKTEKIENSEIKTFGVFIHGRKSQVEFYYYGKRKQKELCDLLFLLTVVNDRKILFEKCTISQFKKNSNTKITRSWEIDKEQLYLLSRFPEFKGISGVVKGKKLKLNNIFGHLGSYNLLYKPGDFTYVTAPVLENLLGNESSIKHSDFTFLNSCLNIIFPFCCFPDYPELRNYLEECFIRYPSSECRYHFEHFLRCMDKCWHYFRDKKCFFHCLPICFSHIYSYNTHDFLFKYLTGRIGELINCDCEFNSFHNKKVKTFIRSVFQYIHNEVKKKKKENQPEENIMKLLGISKSENLEEIVNNISEYIQLKNSENNGGGGKDNVEEEFYNGEGGFGIIHTVINIGEE